MEIKTNISGEGTSKPMFTFDELKEAETILADFVEMHASDIFIVTGQPLSYKRKGKICIHDNDTERVNPARAERLIRQIYQMASRDITRLVETGDDDFSLTVFNLSRFRVSAYKQRNTYSAVIRVIKFGLPNNKEIGVPDNIIELVNKKNGIILVTGPAGSGKSTTLACMIDYYNTNRNGHIITLEDPIEYLHNHKNCIVSQREVGTDTRTYLTALKAALRQSPNVVLLGEMRDHETISVAMTAAETGHLILSTLHTVGAANTIDRIIDAFPPEQQSQIAMQVSMVLQAVVSQQLVPTVDGNQVPVFEIMKITPAIRNMIRENKVHQIDGAIANGAADDMITMDASLINLYNAGTITHETLMRYCINQELVQRKIK